MPLKGRSVFVHNRGQSLQSKKDDIEAVFDTASAQEHMMTASSLDVGDPYLIGDVKLIPTHAYVIYGVDKENRQVMILNPHNSKKPIFLTYDQFAVGFPRALPCHLRY